jgi:hypothetical protein
MSNVNKHNFMFINVRRLTFAKTPSLFKMHFVAILHVHPCTLCGQTDKQTDRQTDRQIFISVHHCDGPCNVIHKRTIPKILVPTGYSGNN